MKKIKLENFYPSKSVPGNKHSMEVYICVVCDCINAMYTNKRVKEIIEELRNMHGKCNHCKDIENQLQYFNMKLLDPKVGNIKPKKH